MSLHTGNLLTGTLAKSEDPDEMQQKAAFHQGMHCLLRLKQHLGTEIHNYCENSSSDTLKYTMGSPILIALICMENPPEYKGLRTTIG